MRHVYVVIWLKMIGDVQEKGVVFICVWLAVSAMNFHVASVCSGTSLNVQYKKAGNSNTSFKTIAKWKTN
jgi:hypothetical protein